MSQTVLRVLIGKGDYEEAVKLYLEIVKLQPEACAMYNLGSLYAQGNGVARNFSEAAYWFRQAALNGEEKAKILETKCMLDYMAEDLEEKTPRRLYDDMNYLMRLLYPKEDNFVKVNENLFALGGHFFNKKDFSAAVKFFRAAGEYGNHGISQNYLAVLFNAGMGVVQNDLAALYWFDRAVDNNCEEAMADRQGLFKAYCNFSAEDFYDQMTLMCGFCAAGSEDIPKDAEKADYWRTVMEKHLEESGKSE